MNIIMNVILLVLIIMALVVGIILFLCWLAEGRGMPRIKFTSFRKFYELNPSRWELCNDYVKCETHVGGRIIYDVIYDVFYFGLIDYYRYVLYKINIEKQKHNRCYIDATIRMVNAVKEDIKNTKSNAEF